MCGISGILSFEKNKIDQRTVKAMANTLRHRGPDDEGFYFDENIGLGFRRLAILDLSSAGHQPMNRGPFWIIFNGEIYNYLELREELKKKGYQFSSGTDSEVILRAYEEWGEDCVKRFNGMWAFAIWDKSRKKLFVSRDRMGVKPFYYYVDRSRFYFSSEIKALLVNKEIKASPNEGIIYDYLLNGQIDHTNETFFEGIKQLPGGHNLVVQIPQGKMEIKKFWDIDPDNKLEGLSDEEYAERFRELFIDSVSLRLRADVPIGTCLSGGLDSSSIVCVVADLLKKEKIEQIGEIQKTFTAAYKNAEYDESAFAGEVVRKARTKDFYTYPSGEKLYEEIDKIIYHQDEPFSSTSIYAQWNVFRLAKEQGVKVMLDGQGSDELLAGYTSSFSAYYAHLLKSLKFLKLLDELSAFSKNYSNKKFLGVSGLSPKLFLSYLLPRSLVQSLKTRTKTESVVLEETFSNEYQDRHLEVNFDPNDSFRNFTYLSLRKSSLPALLHYEDRDSMAFSIEARVPFLDYRLVEFVFSLPNDQKIKDARTKAVLRNAMHGIIPEKVEGRLDKIGFTTPEDLWFRTVLKKMTLDILGSKSFKDRGFINPEKALEQFQNLSSDVNKSSAIWRWVNLELWFRKFID
ncbi:MAG TPA: asparagine synthase (glutamine-hydrolyzing) [Candidatus Nanoarchaeia archaeon]|nr:asparagine synthetase [glutamine-hydrolyzing] 1 [uncultured archaeon]